MSTVTRAWRIPLVLKQLSQFGAEALKPKYIDGRYCGPMVSSRKAADVRKRAIAEGTFGKFSLPYGGWDPSWDEPKNMFLIKPNKGHLRERTRVARANKITAAMKDMPNKIAKYRQEMKDKKPKKDILYKFKRVAELSGRGHGKPEEKGFKK